MAVKTVNELKAQIDGTIKVGPANSITPILDNTVRTNVIDSFLNLKDGGLVLQAETGYSTPITPVSDYSFATKKYVDDGLAGVSPVWGSITGTVTDQTDLINYLSLNYAQIADLSLYTPNSRTITINGTSYDLSANRSWTVGDVLTSGSYSNPTWLTSLAWGKISGTPTTLSGYGITDGQPLATNLTSLSGLTYASTSFVKMTAAGTFTLDTNTYASSSDLTAYAKLDGSNTPFTGNIRIEPTSGNSLILKGATNNNTTKTLSATNLSGSEYFYLRNDNQAWFGGNVVIEAPNATFIVRRTSSSANLWIDSSTAAVSYLDMAGSSSVIRGWSGGIGVTQSFELANSNTVTVIKSKGTRALFVGATESGGTYGNATYYQSTDVINTGNIIKFANQSLSTLSTFTSSTGNWNYTGTAQNLLTIANGIKIGNNTDSAATAGAGSIRYNSGNVEYSNGSAWTALATGTSAPYSFDEVMAASGITAAYGTANTALFIRFVPKANITITKLYYYLTSAGTDTMRLGIWSDSGGAPTTLLQQGSEATTGATTTGLRSVTITSQALTAGTTYWLGVKCDSGASNFGYRTGVLNSNIVRSGFNSGAFGSSPSAFSDSIGAYMAVSV